jgi:hypothetical protein
VECCDWALCYCFWACYKIFSQNRFYIGKNRDIGRELQRVNESDKKTNHKMRELIMMSGKNPRTEGYCPIECNTGARAFFLDFPWLGKCCTLYLPSFIYLLWISLA